MLIKGAAVAPEEETIGDVLGLIVSEDTPFSSCDWPEGGPAEWIHATDSSAEQYIPPADTLPNTPNYMLPSGAMLPICRRVPAWTEPPSAARCLAVKTLLMQTSNFGQIEDPKHSRIKHLVGLHLGGPQPRNTPHAETRIEWLRDNWDTYTGIPKRRGWYWGPLTWDANGLSNWHYNRLLTIVVAYVFEPDAQKRAAAWPFLAQQGVHYAALGRYWRGVHRGRSRNEKGTYFIGDGEGPKYEKDWVPNLAALYLLTGQELFLKALTEAATFYASVNVPAIWRGYWGARIPARFIENCLMIRMMLPAFRAPMDAQIAAMLYQCGQQFDRAKSVWPNVGNLGTAEESPWMQLELIGDILRTWEQIPDLKDYGVRAIDVENAANRIIFGDGSEVVGEHRCIRYRYNTTIVPPSNIHLTGFALPVIRMLQMDTPMGDFFLEYAGSALSDVRAGVPRDINSIGYRNPPEGQAWPKSILEITESDR